MSHLIRHPCSLHRSYPVHTHPRPYSRIARAPQLDLSLCLVTDRRGIKHETEFYSKIARSIKGGVSCVQLRDPIEHIQKTLETAKRLQKMLKPTGIPLIVNNRLDVALAAKAGVHLGQRDFPYSEARRLLGKKAIIGLTVETLEDVRKAQQTDVNYLGVQIYPSKQTKPETFQWWDIEGLKAIRKVSDLPILVIGGITPENIPFIYREMHKAFLKGPDGIAMVGELWRSPDPFEIAKKIRLTLERSRNQQPI